MPENPKTNKLSNALHCKVITRSSHLQNVVNSVPTELWLQILGHLSIVELSMAGAVCTRLYVISKHSSLWQKLEFDIKTVNASMEAVKNVIDRAVNVKELKFTNKDNKEFDSLALASLVIRARKTLKVLILSPDIKLKKVAVAKFKCLDKLEVLDVALDRICNTTVKAIAKLKNLREIRPIHRLSVYPALNSEDNKLKYLFGELNNLKVVDLTNISITQDTLKTLALNNPSLETLILPFALNSDTNISLSDLTINCPNLKHLNLSRWYGMSDADIEALARAKKLVHLDLGGCDRLTDDMMINISKNCPQLTYLNIFDCTQRGDDAIRALAKNCPNLEYLEMDGCPNVSERAFEELVMACKKLKFIGALNKSPTFRKQLRKDRPDLQVP